MKEPKSTTPLQPLPGKPRCELELVNQYVKGGVQISVYQATNALYQRRRRGLKDSWYVYVNRFSEPEGNKE